ncbi:Glycosyltransferase AglE [uncultured archaeon]|nr:Glycosyltransferase AglE [uncultured archaeon]
MAKGKVALSVVIPAFNEQKYIAYVLGGLRKQTFTDFETIVVDGNSSDRTREIARSAGARVILEKRKGIGLARNSGSKAARGDIVVFLDADTCPSESLLATYYGAFANRKIVAATGPILPLEKTSRRVDLGYRFVSVLFVKSSILVGKPSVVGSNFAVRKKVFDRIGGFNEKYITYEDWDLSLRLRKAGRIAYLDDAVVYTSVRRIAKWGMFGFFIYHTTNVLRYYLLKRPNEEYEPVR